jgi:hypothetical protein
MPPIDILNEKLLLRYPEDQPGHGPYIHLPQKLSLQFPFPVFNYLIRFRAFFKRQDTQLHGGGIELIIHENFQNRHKRAFKIKIPREDFSQFFMDQTPHL